MRTWIDSFRADTVFGWRQLRKSAVTSLAAILSLALAIGACTTAFRLIDALLLRPLPVAEPERLHVVAFEGPGMESRTLEYDSCSYPMFTRMRDEVREQADLVGVSYADRADLTYGSDQDMERAHTQYVSGSMFPMFGLHPATGRLFTANDDDKPGAHAYAVLSWDYWTRRFAGDPRIVGRTFRIGDTLFQIIGVAEQRFTGTETGTVTDVFLPMMMKSPRSLASPDNFWLRTFVRLRPNADARGVEDRLGSVFRTIQKERAKNMTAMSPARLANYYAEKMVLRGAAAGRSNMQRDYQTALVALAIHVALVLLIACANVANLMTARAAARAREMAVRVSIGAGRARLVQLVLIESAWLAVLASVAGALIAWWSAPVVLGMINPPDVPARLILTADCRVFLFGLAVAVGVTFLFGLLPALRASSVKPASALKGGDDPHSRRRVMHVLIAVQVAFCFLVLFVGGLFVGTFDKLTNQENGFSSERILNLETAARHPQAPAYWDRIAADLRAVPGVEGVALTGWPLMRGEANTGDISIGGAPPSDVFADFLSVSPGWMETMKIPLIDGRDFRPEETNPGVAIVNQAFAKQYFNGADPTGKWFERMDGTGKRVRLEIVGFIRDARSRDRVRLAIRPTVCIPFYSGRPVGRGTFVVKTAGANPLSLAAALRAGVSRGRSEAFVQNIRTQTEINAAQMLKERLLAVLAFFFAGVALVLAGVGLYGVLDYSVLQRRREIGIRIAIGARSGEIARRVTQDVFVMVVAGAASGVALGALAVRYLEALFFGVKPMAFGSLAIPAVAVMGAALLAALPSVVRAVRTDLIKALRAE